MPVRRLVGFPPWRTGPTGPASSVGPDRARTPRHFGAGLRLRGFQSSDLLRQPPGSVPGVVVVRGDRGGRAHEQSCGKDPALGRAVAQERLRLPQRSRMPVRGAHVDRGPNPAVAETSGAGLPVSRDRGSSGWPSRSAITGPSWGLNGYDQEKLASQKALPNSSLRKAPKIRRRIDCSIGSLNLIPAGRLDPKADKGPG